MSLWWWWLRKASARQTLSISTSVVLTLRTSLTIALTAYSFGHFFVRNFLSDLPSIMTSYESSLRLQFLQNAASLLCTGSISTASHLMMQHNDILHEDSKPIKLRQHESWCRVNPDRCRKQSVLRLQVHKLLQAARCLLLADLQ